MQMTRVSRCALWLLAALVCLAPAAFAGNQYVTAQLDNPPSNNILDGIYVGPYNGVNTQTGAAMQMTCDDFKDESNSNVETYTVNTLSNLGNAIWGSMPNATKLYEEAGWLDLGMMNQTGAQQGYYSYALWAIFQPNQVLSWLQSYHDYAACNAVFGAGNNCQSTTITAGGLLSLASLDYSQDSYSNMLILTPTCVGGVCQEQEFLEFTTPEGGATSLYLLLSGLAGVAAVVWSRRRSSDTAMVRA
jgi:hypothetical protein